MGEEGGGGRRKGKEEGRIPTSPTHYSPTRSPGSISLTSRPHALPPASVDERRCRALEVSASDWDLERYVRCSHVHITSPFQ